MIIDKEIEIKITNRNIKYYKELGYLCFINDIININVNHISKGSKVKVNCKCNSCGDIKSVIYKNYKINILKHNFYVCSKKECYLIKSKLTSNEKYGFDNIFQNYNYIKECFNNKYGVYHPMHLKVIRDRVSESRKNRSLDEIKKSDMLYKKTSLIRYGFVHVSKSPKFQEMLKTIRIANGCQIPDDMLEPYTLYRREVDKISDRNKLVLLTIWDGNDYYDNEYIKENFKLVCTDRLYPTIDHKISVLNGFKNKIPVDIIAGIDNLCFTKMFLNCSKGSMNHDEFISFLQQ